MSTEYLHINTSAVQILGLNCAAFISELLSRPNNEDFFLLELQKIVESIGIDRHKGVEAIQKLTDLKIIKTKRLPSKNNGPLEKWVCVDKKQYDKTIIGGING